MVSGTNTEKISQVQFLVACNRFGIDNPCPIITKRLSCYGNAEDVEKDFRRLAEKYKRTNPDLPIDPEMYPPAELKFNALDINKYKKIFDFNETVQVSPVKKFSGITNFQILT